MEVIAPVEVEEGDLEREPLLVRSPNIAIDYYVPLHLYAAIIYTHNSMCKLNHRKLSTVRRSNICDTDVK